MSNKNDGGPAFPRSTNRGDYDYLIDHPGMSLRAYAAIKLKVPDSGINWLDEMIIKSRRDDFAAKAMEAFIISCDGRDWPADEWNKNLSFHSYKISDAMPRARDEN